MTTPKERINALQTLLMDQGLDGYLIPSSDPHMSEYLPDHYMARSWFSGFNGSAGTLAVTRNKAALWTDGRYFIQAERQLQGSGILLMKMLQPGVPTVEEWLSLELPEKGVMGIHGMITNMDTVEKMKTAFEEKGISLQDKDLISSIWAEERPALPATKAWILKEQFSGKSPSQKLLDLKKALKEEKADAFLVTRLDSAAWLLNLRADDILFNPFALCFCLVLPESAALFIDQSRLCPEAKAYLEKEGFSIAPYEAVQEAISTISAPITMLCQNSGTSFTLREAMEKNPCITVKTGTDPIEHLKGVKNETEIKNLINAHKKDGVAMVRFAMELEKRIKNGQNTTECDVDALLRDFRLEQEHCLGESFGTIAAYGANAAMMHYHPTPDHCDTLAPSGFLLVDCGGQYLDGTTDITRTYALGTPTEEEKDYYTLVLKAHIRLAKLVFKEKLPGMALDLAAREPFWERGLDYRCGTGHGVGFVGGVHEGPHSLNSKNTVPFLPGMIVTDEPGIYEDGKIGIRIENELLCKEAFETEYGKFYCFEPVTFCPIDTKAVELSKLSDEELEWLNQYHKTVAETLSPLLTSKEKEWLEKACAPLSRTR